MALRIIHAAAVLAVLLAAMAASGLVRAGAAPAPLGAVALSPRPLAAAYGLIAPGKWELQDLDSAAPALSMCVADPEQFVQLQHAGRQCSRFVVDDSPTSATVHYTCPGAGHGRTVIQVENARRFRLDTLGISSGAPFEFRYEARRVGACTVPR